MELHVVRRFRYLHDLRETRCALPHLRWWYVVAGGSPCRRIPLPHVSRAALLVLDLHPVDLLPSTFCKRADMPVLDVSCDIDSFDLGVQCLAFSPCGLPEVIRDVHLLGATLIFGLSRFIVMSGCLCHD